MPIYAYKCSACGYAKDTLQKMSDAPLTTCPECGQETYSKQVTAAGFQLKGSGWYVTDFRNNGTAPGKSDGKTVVKLEGASEGKSESKSEGSSEGKSESNGASGATESSAPAKTESAAPAASESKAAAPKPAPTAPA